MIHDKAYRKIIVGIVVTLVLVGLFVGTGAAATNIFTNPDFSIEYGSGWSTDYSGGGYPNDGNVNLDNTGRAILDVSSNNSQTMQYAYLYQNVNLTGVDEVTFNLRVSSKLNISSTDIFGYVRIGNSMVSYTVGSGSTSYTYFTLNNLHGGSTSSSYVTLHVNTSGYSGSNNFGVYLYTGALSPSSSNTVWVDMDVTNFAGYNYSPTITSPSCSPSSGGLTNTVTLSATVTNTEGTASYQWQEYSNGSWDNIPNATSKSSQVSITDTSATTHTYRLYVTNTMGGSAYSTSVTYSSVAPPVLSSVTATYTVDGSTIDAFANIYNKSYYPTSSIPMTVTYSCTAANFTNTFLVAEINSTSVQYQITSSSGSKVIDLTQWVFTGYTAINFYVICDSQTSDAVTKYVDLRNLTFTASSISNGYSTLELSGDNVADITANGTIQWAYHKSSESGSTFTNISGATYSPYTWSVPESTVYDVRVSGYSSNSMAYSVTIDDVVNSNPATISFDTTTYTTSGSVVVTWDMSTVYSATNSYAFRIYLVDSTGDTTESDTPLYNSDDHTEVTINATGTLTIPCSSFTSGFIKGYLINKSDSNSTVATTGVATVTVLANLKIKVTNVYETWTESTTISLYESDGTTPVAEETGITSGNYTFTNLNSPKTYVIKIVSGSYSQQGVYVFNAGYAGVTKELSIDFTYGFTEKSSTSGSGTQYASTYVTFRVIDENTGAYLSGVGVTAVAKEATNPAEWIANLFGSAWGGEIKDTELSGKTDAEGKITFAMFPVYRYAMTFTVYKYDSNGNITETLLSRDYSFQPTTLTTEEIIKLPVYDSITTESSIKTVSVEFDFDDSTGVITVDYNDQSGTNTTQKVNIYVYQYIDGVQYPTWNPASESYNYQKSGNGSNEFSYEYQADGSYYSSSDEGVTWTFHKGSSKGYQRKDYLVVVDGFVTTYFTTPTQTEPSVTRSDGHSFTGVRIQIGDLPDALYLVLSFGILIMLGAVGTQVTSRFYAIVVAGVGAFLFWAGWMESLGLAGEIVCVVAFVIAILYYIAGGNQPQ